MPHSWTAPCLEGSLNATAIQGCCGQPGRLQPAMPVGKQTPDYDAPARTVAIDLPSRLRQRYQAILVALGIADRYALTLRIEITHLEAQPFAAA